MGTGKCPLGIPNHWHFFWGGGVCLYLPPRPRLVVRMSPRGGAGEEKDVSNNRSHRAFP